MSKQNVPQCPLGHGDMIKEKEWIVRGKGGGGGIIWELFRCPQCNQTFRRKGAKKT